MAFGEAMMGVASPSAIRGRLVWFEGDPAENGSAAIRDVEDGLVVVEDGRIAAVGAHADLARTLPEGAEVADHRGCLVMPGFIDTHIHFPQTQVIASYGAQLLEWLQKYTFVEEQKYGDPVHAAAGAAFFLDELLRNGTTTAVVYCSVHPQSAEAFFTAARARRLRMIAGKVMMDRNAPPALTDTPERGYRESKALLERWHGVDRLGYAITPRFALTSTDAQLEAAGTLAREHPECWMQSHLSENRNEIATALSLYPTARDYTDIYDRFGLLGPKSIYGHCIHLSEREMARLSESRSVAGFCPTSNLFIGSGLFDMAAMRDPRRPVRVSLATDVGGGTSYSMLQTAAEAYKVLQLKGQNLPSPQAFYLKTLGNARALGLEHAIGRLSTGLEADLVVLDPAATPAMAHRMATIDGDLAETLFVLMTMGDDRAVRASYVLGARASPRI
ncbi:MAG TPA: guanine deaminase [Geminicoccaceae bacterium]|nr:guanine deaminase [Geminicoccaceae bacterium]